MDPLLFKELQGFVNILQAVDPHTTPCRPWLEMDTEMNYYFWWIDIEILYYNKCYMQSYVQ